MLFSVIKTVFVFAGEFCFIECIIGFFLNFFENFKDTLLDGTY
jgi:hypothetical protein